MTDAKMNMTTSTKTLTGKLIKANWPAPQNVHAFCTTRQHGFSQKPFGSLNLGEHVGDSADAVQQNRNLISKQLQFKTTPLWLNQVHGNEVIDSKDYGQNIDADAITSQAINTPLVIMTADCLPILLCDKQGRHIAAIHAGWRSLFSEIISKTFKQLNIHAHKTLAWLGPCISQQHFEIGNEVKKKFCQKDTINTNAFNLNNDSKKYHACLHTLAKNELMQLGITAIYESDFCTYENSNDFFSYRREKITGRMATFIWMDTVS